MILEIARMLFLASLAFGGASLARLSDAFLELGAVGEIRFIGLLLAATIALLVGATRGSLSALKPVVTLWIGLALGVHAYVATSWLWSDRTPFALIQLYELALLCISLVLMVPLFRRDPARALRLLLMLFYLLSLAFTATALAVVGQPVGELGSIGAGGIGTARVLSMGIIAGVVFAEENGRRAWLLPLPPMFAGIMVSGSRAAVLALAVTLVVIWGHRTVNRRRAGPKRPLRSIVEASVAGLLAVVVLMTSTVRDLAMTWVQLLLVPSRATNGRQIYLADRDVIFRDAAGQFAANPVGGLGLGTYSGPFGERYPHNLLLNFAVDAGAVALLICLGLLAYAFSRIAFARGPAALMSLAGGSFFAVASTFAGTYYDARFVWIFLLLGLLQIDRDWAASCGVRGKLEIPSARCGQLPAGATSAAR